MTTRDDEDDNALKRRKRPTEPFVNNRKHGKKYPNSRNNSIRLLTLFFKWAVFSRCFHYVSRIFFRPEKLSERRPQFCFLNNLISATTYADPPTRRGSLESTSKSIQTQIQTQTHTHTHTQRHTHSGTHTHTHTLTHTHTHTLFSLSLTYTHISYSSTPA